MQKVTTFIKQQKLISALILIAVLIVGYNIFNAIKGNTVQETYTLSSVEKGTIITSISGSGQVSVLDQTDIMPKASGEITTVYVDEGDTVKAGEAIAQINPVDALRSVRDAKLGLDSANLAMEKLKNSSDQSTLTQAENAVDSAQRDLDQAKKAQEQQTLDTTQSLQSAYEDAYNTISSTFLDLPSIIDDLGYVKRPQDGYSDENIAGYKSILGKESIFITTFLNDYDLAITKYSPVFISFKGTSRSADTTKIYQLLNDTYSMTRNVSQALQDASNIFDAITNSSNYTSYTIGATVDSLSPTITADITKINSEISTLKSIKDTIDTTNQDAPINDQKAADAVTSAEENLTAKQQSLTKIQAGADPLDIESQQITITQKENALADAQSKLSDYTIRAPYSGLIATINSKKGDTVSSGTAVAVLITNQKIAEISLNEVDAAKVEVGQKATLTFDAIDGLEITGKVTGLDLLGTVSQGVVTYTAKIGFDTQDDRIKSGMSVSAAIITEVKQDALMVPNSAIKTSQDDSSYVEMLDKAVSETQASQGVTSLNPPIQQTVVVGISNDTSTEIISGLKEGDQVITKTTSSTVTAKPAAASSLFGAGGSGGGKSGAGALLGH